MGHEKKYIFPFFIIVVLSLSSFCSSMLRDDHIMTNDYFKEESGYDFGAFPTHFSFPGNSILDNSNSIKQLENGFFGFVKSRKLAAAVKTVNVLNFGAKANGRSDDTKTFVNAWKEACSSSSTVNFLVPGSRSYLLKPIRFTGPCKSAITMQIAGKIIASDDRSDYNKDRRHWILFDSVNNLVVEGGGTINGNGDIWWKNSCKIDKSKPCTQAPTAITFYKCTNLVVKNLKIQNGQQINLSIEKCKHVEVSNLVVTAPGNSPNTDGIHIAGTQDITISTSKIGTGDDCISIVSGSQKVRATDITCGPGHGISIGSLGAGGSQEYVSDVVINGAKLYETTNGVRIKTWQGGSGSASNIKFENIEMQNVENPIIIDQNYCDQEGPCKQKSSAVQVKDVVYKNIKGTSSSKVAIKFECSKSHPCQGILMEGVDLRVENGDQAQALYNNINLKKSENILAKFP